MPFIIPHVFKAGEKAVAAEVNENFNYLKESMVQINTTLDNKINTAKSTLDEQIGSIKNDIQITDEKNNIINLGNIMPSEVDENGEIPPANIELQADRIHCAAIFTNSALVFPALEETQENTKFINILFEFTLGADYSLTLPSDIKFTDGEVPEIIADGTTLNRLLFDTTTNGKSWICYHNTVSQTQEDGNE